MTDFFCDNLRRYLAGQPLANLVDKRLGLSACATASDRMRDSTRRSAARTSRFARRELAPRKLQTNARRTMLDAHQLLRRKIGRAQVESA